MTLKDMRQATSVRTGDRQRTAFQLVACRFSLPYIALCAFLCADFPSPAEEIGAEAPVLIVNAVEEESGGQPSAAPRHLSTFQPFNFSTSSSLRGAMIGALRTDGDWDTLASWGATLVRHQIICKGFSGVCPH